MPANNPRPIFVITKTGNAFSLRTGTPMTPPPSRPSPLPPTASDAFDRIENLDALLAASHASSQTTPAPAEPVGEEIEDTPDPIEQSLAKEGVLVHSPQSYRPGAALLVPAILLLLVAFGLLGYRLGHPDWHWDAAAVSPSAPLKTPDPLADAADPAVAQAELPGGGAAADPADQPDPSARAADVQVSQADPKTAGDLPLPPLPEPATAAEPDASTALAAKDPNAASGPAEPGQLQADVLADIQNEAKRLKAEREELEKHKLQEGKKMAQEAKNRPPAASRGLTPAQIVARHRAMDQLLRQQMAANQQQFEAMRRRQQQFMNRGFGFNGAAQGDFDRAIQQMQREMDGFQGDALGMLGLPGGLAVPPPPHADEPPAGDDANQEQDKAKANEKENGNDPAANWPPRSTPRIRQFRSIDPRTGAVLQGFKMQWSNSAQP